MCNSHESSVQSHMWQGACMMGAGACCITCKHVTSVVTKQFLLTFPCSILAFCTLNQAVTVSCKTPICIEDSPAMMANTTLFATVCT